MFAPLSLRFPLPVVLWRALHASNPISDTRKYVISDKHHNATNVITDKHHNATNIKTDKRHNATNGISNKRHKETNFIDVINRQDFYF